jgi:hypothetical protein
MNVKVAAASAVAAVGLLTGTASAVAHPDHHSNGDLTSVRSATDAFHNVATAEQHGYGLLTDVNGVACIDMPGMGGMGVHWAKTALVDDPAIRPRHPEALVYAPQADGTLRLAAVEYVVVKQAWDATHQQPPTLFGHRFDFTDSPNRFGLPAFYSLHAWAYKANPAGTFSLWNPRVVC